VSCDEIRGLLSAHADGELDLLRAVEVERHLEACAACAEAMDGLRALSDALKDPALYHQPPIGLRERVRRSARPKVRLVTWRPIAAAVAAAALVGITAWAAVRGPAAPTRDNQLAREVVASHVRSLMLEEHQVDVKSSDQHKVKPWFLGKIDVAPEVKDLAAQGFPLKGGRLDYIDDRPAAALVYERNKHVINVLIWRTDGADQPPEHLDRQGYHLIRWTDNGRAFWVVSDLNPEELGEFTQLLRR
jgi:anti-sigma factor RsiW